MSTGTNTRGREYRAMRRLSGFEYLIEQSDE